MIKRNNQTILCHKEISELVVLRGSEPAGLHLEPHTRLDHVIKFPDCFIMDVIATVGCFQFHQTHLITQVNTNQFLNEGKIQTQMEQVHWKDLQGHMTHACEALINCTQNICFNNLVHRAAVCDADINPYFS